MVLIEEVEDVDAVDVGRDRTQRSPALLSQVILSSEHNRDWELSVVNVLERRDQVNSELKLWSAAGGGRVRGSGGQRSSSSAAPRA